MADKGGRPKRETRRRALYILGLAALALLMIGFWIISYSMVTDRIMETSMQNMEELAAHDEQAILNNLHSKWETMEGIARFVQQHKYETTEELMADLSSCKQLMECLRLRLVAEDGLVLDSNGKISRDEELLRICQETGGHFIRRVESSDAMAVGRGEELRAGVNLQPFTVEGNTYRYLVARLDISTFESDLRIDSYNGRGYSSVIDRDGNYIVNVDRDYTAQSVSNFYDMLAAGTLPGEYPLERVKELIGAQEPFSLEYTREDGERCVVIFDPMVEIEWFFVTVVPKAVFQEQSMSLIKIFALLIAVMLASVGAAMALVLRRRSKLLQLEKKHRQELSDALVLAEQANRAKTTFLNNISHDIRTPMNAIIGFTALASTHIDNRERVKDYLDKIAQSSSHMLSLINDVLDMSRIESGKMNLDEKPENLAEIMHSLRNIVQADIHAKQLELFIDTVDVTDENICCDKLRLNQILLNIISNAIKFTAPGGTVSIRILETGTFRPGYGTYEFRVKDTGIGMSQEFIDSIFEAFTRERSSTVSGIQGTGLGMSIAKSIVDMMGGSITVTSEEGKGTEFIVTLEFRLQEGRREIEPIEQLKGLRGLVVDDDINTCQSVSQMLRRIGLRSEWTGYGKEAVVRTQEAMQIGDPFHVYIIDWLMPDLNGIETARRIRKVVGDDAPIIILSAYDWADIEAEARDAGVTDFISKPLFLSDLHRVLLRACGEPPAREREEPQPDPDFSGRRLLLVEDNELNQEIAQEILCDAGFEVETAENGAKAVQAVRDAPPGRFDAVLMDIQMPVMDGYQATRAIRDLEDPLRSGIPIIAMTANAFVEDKQAAWDAGMDAHIGKPIDIPILMETLRRVLGG